MPDTKIVGILNLTPDSFSDGGQFFTPIAAIKHIMSLIAHGADVVDIGAESTRPGATPLTADEEWQRLEPVLKQLIAFPDIPFSLDSRHAATVEKATAYGIAYINDVSGFGEHAMVAAVRKSSCKLIVMHSLTVPADKSVMMPESEDVVASLLAFAQKRIETLVAAGIAKERIIFDPGLGFGKSAAQSFTILRHIDQLKILSVALYIGHSRKSFLGADRDAATLALSQYLMEKHVGYIRVHDVAAHKQLATLLGKLHG